MKKRVFVLLLLCMLALSGCKASEPASAPEQTPEPTPDPIAIEIEHFFQQYVDTNERPIAIMVDNDDKNARPHAGLDEAYILYELPVEGGATRFLALYRGAETEKIGPVRSSRHYFLDYVMEHNAIYTHFGWSPRAIQDIPAFGINNINGLLGADGNIFWREQKYKGDWHSAYTNIEKIKARAEEKGYKTETAYKSGIRYANEYISLSPDKPALSIKLPYSTFYNTGYVFNAETGLYEKLIHGQPHMLQNGEVLSVRNVLVMFIQDTSLGDGSDRRELITTGSGKGYYFTGGAYEEITWSKPSRRENTVYKKADGTELYINPGKTAINIIAPTSGVVIEPAPLAQ